MRLEDLARLSIIAVQVLRDELKGVSCRLTDLFTRAAYERKGEEMVDPGLYIDLEAWRFHFLRL